MLNRENGKFEISVEHVCHETYSLRISNTHYCPELYLNILAGTELRVILIRWFWGWDKNEAISTGEISIGCGDYYEDSIRKFQSQFSFAGEGVPYGFIPPDPDELFNIIYEIVDECR